VAVTILKEFSYETPDPIFSLDCIAHALLVHKGVLKILFLAYNISVLVLQPESEVSQDPKEAREVLRHLVCVCCCFTLPNLKRLGEIDDEAQVVQSVLVYRAHTVIDHQRAKKHRQQKDFGVMILLLVKGTKTFGVDDEDRKLLIFIGLAVKHFFPDPETFGASVDGRAYLEAIEFTLSLLFKLIHEELVHEVRLARPILSTDRDDPYFAFDSTQKLYGLLRNMKTLRDNIVFNEWNGHAILFARIFHLFEILLFEIYNC
jgi:hypothetical protein